MDPRVNSATSTAVTVGNTSTSVLAANPDRKAVVLVNDSDTDIYVELSASATINEGVRLNAGGGSFRMDLSTGIYLGAISAIASAGSKNMTVIEL